METQNQMFNCTICNKSLKSNKTYQSHLKSKTHKEKESQQNNNIDSKIRLFNENVTKQPKTLGFHYKYLEYEWDVVNNEEMIYILQEYYKLYKSFKFYNSFEVLYNKQKDEEIEHLKMGHVCHPQVLTNINDLEDKLHLNINDLNNKIRETELRESGWNLEQITKVNLYLINYKDSVGGSYIKLPFKSSYIINIKNQDPYCFIWSIIAYLHPAPDHVDRINNYNKQEYINELNLDGINFPINYQEIKKFYNQNKNIIDFNVFEINELKELTPIFNSHNNPIGCNILYYQGKNENGESVGHYVLCKNLAVFMKNCDTHKAYPCLNCLTSYRTQNALYNHLLDCYNHDTAKVIFSDDNYLSFNKFHYKNKLPFTIYADFESWNKPVEYNNGNKIYQQLPMCFGLYIHSNYPELIESEYIEYFGEDCVYEFVKIFEQLQDKFYRLLHTNIPIEMTDKDEENFQNSTVCFYCNKELEDDKVRDHDHLSGKYRGAAHNSCNLNVNIKLKDLQFVPLYFYNGSHYDNHLIFKELYQSPYLKQFKPKTLCKTDEEYFSVQFGYIRILDAFRFFTPYSLDFMGQTLKIENCKILTKHNLKNLKGIYPYEYIQGNNFEQIEEIMNESQLPLHENFYSTLKQKNISNEEYELAKNNWNELGCETLKDYTMKYLKIDVLILADLFENFRDTCLKYYEIDPCYCYSTPGLTWVAGLKYTGVNLKYYKEDTYDKLLFFENGIRGGVSSVLGDRYVNCNNKKTNPEYDPAIKIPTEYEFNKVINEFYASQTNNFDMTNCFKENYLLYYDANSLYPSAMIQELPTGEMEWANNLIYEKTYPGHYGYVYEVDLRYPEEIKEKTKYYPFCPENTTPSENELSLYQIYHKPDKYKPHNKLLITQYDKLNYVIEGRMLDWYLDHGMELVWIHKKLVYKKSKWLKPYMEFNIEKRTEAKNNKDAFGTFFKLMNNAFYGKTLENVRNRQNIEIVYDEERYQPLTTKPTFKRIKAFSNNLVAVHLKRSTVKQDKFNFIGSTILELSKLIMYQFVYDCIDKKIDDWKIHYGDTDSIFLEIKIPFNSSLEEEVGKFDGEYIHPTDLCKFKDELEGKKFIKEFIALKSKCYSYTTNKDSCVKLKGISKASQNQICFENYKNTLFNNEILFKDNSRLISENHEIFLINQRKKALDSFDDKRLISNNGINTLPFGN